MMPLIIAIPMFLLACCAMYIASKMLVQALGRIAIFLKWREFILAFFLMAFGVSIPNFFVAIMSGLKGVPELSFGDVIGGNIFDLSLALGLAAIVSKKGIDAKSRTVSASVLFTMGATMLPLLLVFDKQLSRLDGFFLIIVYLIYSAWMFSDKERFTLQERSKKGCTKKLDLIRDLIMMACGIGILLLGAKGIVDSSIAFSQNFSIPLAVIGVVVVSVGNCLPETFFSIQAAKCKQEWMILGNLMGGVVVCTTLVVGTAAIIHPIDVDGLSAFVMARIFMIMAIILFYTCIRSGNKITKTEGYYLVLLYIIFILLELIMY
jgi:cation:H+ antiporter